MSFDIVDVDHALAFVRVAFATGCDARAAADAPRRVKEDSLDLLCHIVPLTAMWVLD